MVNNKDNNNKNSSNSLVFGRWPQTKIILQKIQLLVYSNKSQVSFDLMNPQLSTEALLLVMLLVSN